MLLGDVNSNVAQDSQRPSRTYLFEPFSFKPLSLVQHGQVFHYHTDHIGTPREITNARAEVVWSSTFKTYGALALAHVNEVENPLRFQGQYFDSETGLHYNRHRYYDPNCGQFTTQDPIGLLGGMNAYQYAPNPMTWVDPWGLKCKEWKDLDPGLSTAKVDEILATPKGQRPDPSSYLSENYIQRHGALFESGAARIQPSAPTGTIGRTETWVFPKSLVSDAVSSANGDPRKLESLLGLDANYLGEAPVLVDIPNPQNLRVPSGNEFGANDLWRPGGLTYPGRIPEAVIDPVLQSGYSVSPVFK